MSIEDRIRKIEKALTPFGAGRCYVDIWSLPAEQWAQLAEWALGNTDNRPDFRPSEEQTIELRQQGYVVETRDELRETFEMVIEANKRAREVGLSGLDWRSIEGPDYRNGQEAV